MLSARRAEGRTGTRRSGGKPWELSAKRGQLLDRFRAPDQREVERTDQITEEEHVEEDALGAEHEAAEKHRWLANLGAAERSAKSPEQV